MSQLPSIFIDGQEGTTGLRIRDLLGERTDVNVRLIDQDRRKDTEARRQLLNDVDLAILCLPDDAAAEALALIEPDSGTRVIDTSTVRRVHDDWVYGVPELSPAQRQAIRTAHRVARPIEVKMDQIQRRLRPHLNPDSHFLPRIRFPERLPFFYRISLCGHDTKLHLARSRCRQYQRCSPCPH